MNELERLERIIERNIRQKQTRRQLRLQEATPQDEQVNKLLSLEKRLPSSLSIYVDFTDGKGFYALLSKEDQVFVDQTLARHKKMSKIKEKLTLVVTRVAGTDVRSYPRVMILEDDHDGDAIKYAITYQDAKKLVPNTVAKARQRNDQMIVKNCNASYSTTRPSRAPNPSSAPARIELISTREYIAYKEDGDRIAVWLARDDEELASKAIGEIKGSIYSNISSYGRSHDTIRLRYLFIAYTNVKRRLIETMPREGIETIRGKKF